MAKKELGILASLSDSDYRKLLDELRTSMTGTRISLARRINETMMQLYWNIGRTKTATTCRSFTMGTQPIAYEQVDIVLRYLNN